MVVKGAAHLDHTYSGQLISPLDRRRSSMIAVRWFYCSQTHGSARIAKSRIFSHT